MQGAEDLGQPLQVAVEWRGGILGPRGVRLQAKIRAKMVRKRLSIGVPRMGSVCLLNTLEARRGSGRC